MDEATGQDPSGRETAVGRTGCKPPLSNGSQICSRAPATALPHIDVGGELKNDARFEPALAVFRA